MSLAAPLSPSRSSARHDLAAVAVCGLIWGTTWYAITLQFGPVPSAVSVVYRFGLSAALIFVWQAARRRSLRLTAPQHLAALGQGVFTFAVSYALVYGAEERIASAVVAVMFAGLAFVNLVLFRLVHGTRAAWAAWAGAVLGVVGVAVLSFSQLAAARMDARALTGLYFAMGAVCASAIGNLFAFRGAKTGAAVGPATGWAMVYGTVVLAIWALVSGARFSFDPRPAYWLSLVYLAAFGSVVAFLVYFALARRRGYTLASYISALTPPLALGMSAVLEHARFGWGALAGVSLVLAGQVMLLRAPKA